MPSESSPATEAERTYPGRPAVPHWTTTTSGPGANLDTATADTTTADTTTPASPAASAPRTVDVPVEVPGAADPHRSTGRWFLLRPVAVYLVCRAVTLASLVVADLFTHKGLSGDLYIWDGRWFIRAAQHGWPAHLPMVSGHVSPSTVAFLPAFPLAIRWMCAVTGLSPVAVGVAISGVTGLTAIIAVGMLVRHFADAAKAERAALLLAVFPGTFVFSLVYAEGIVITCVALGLLALLRRQWWLAGILGLVASATSPIALAFVVSCAWCAGSEIRHRRDWRSLAAPVLAPLGFVSYMVWLRVHTGNLWAWRVAERGGWKSYPSLGYPIHIVTTFVVDPVAPTRTGQLLMIGTVAAVIGAAFAIRERQPAPVLLYGLVAVGMAAISAPVGLRPRFLMLAFPLIVAVGTRLRGRAYGWTLAVSVCLLAVMSLSTLASTAVFP
jgi:hypothetical protein